MANRIGSLYYSLNANAAGLFKELNKANKSVKKFSKAARKQVNQSAKAFGAVGVAAAGATAVIVSSQLKAIDALAKTSNKLGITTKNLAGLTQAAKITGVEQSVLNKALVRQQKAIADANNGLETYARQFRALNLDTKELAKLNPAEQFKVVADALNKVENQTQKTAIAYDIFGGRATDLINTMKLGSEGLNAFEEEAVSLGLAVTRIDAAKVEAANDAIVRAKGAAEGLGNKLTIALAPYIEEVATQFVDAMKNGEDMGQRVSDAVAFMGRTIAFGADAANGVGVAFKLLSAIGQTAAAAMVTGFSILPNVLNEINQRVLSVYQTILEVGASLPSDLGGDLFKDGAANVAALKAGLDASVSSVNDFASGLRDNAASAWEDVHNAAMEEVPSVAINAYFDNLEQRAQAAAVAIADAANANVSSAGGEVSTQLAPLDNAAFQEKLDERLQMQIAHTEQAHAAELTMAEALDAQKLENQLLTDEALIAMATEFATAKVMAEWEAKQLALEEVGEALTPEQRLEQQREIEEASLSIAAEMAQKRAQIEAEKAKEVQKYDLTTFKGKANTLSATLGLMGSFGKKSEKLQKAAMLANKAIAIKDSIVAITGGIAKALNNPYPANLAFAASVAAQGAGLMSTLASVGGGGGGGGGSSFSGGGATTPSYASNNVADDEEVKQRESQTAVQVFIEGNLHADEDYLWNKVIPGIQEAVKERDVVFIDAESRQAEELALA